MAFTKFFLILATLLVHHSDKTESQEKPSSSKKSIRYLALGDSYTIGESVPSNQNFPHLFEKELKNAGLTVEETKIIAKTGWRTDDLMQAIKREKLTGTYDVVTLLIGVNNQYQHKPIEQYKKEFRILLETAIQLAGGKKDRVFVISIPDYGYTPFGKEKQKEISADINIYNKINKVISSEIGVKRFDITPISRQGLKRSALVASDGLHPSGAMYQEWVDLFNAKIVDALNIQDK